MKSIHLNSDWFRINPIFNNGLLNGNYRKVCYDDIVYISSSDRKNIRKIVTNDFVVYDTRSLYEFASTYKQFVRISRSYVLNINFVDKRSDWNILWIGELKFKVGRKYRDKLKSAFEGIL